MEFKLPHINDKNHKKKNILLKIFITAMVCGMLFYTLLYFTDKYFDNHDLIFQAPVIFQKPILVKEKKLVTPVFEEKEGKVQVKNLEDYLNSVAKANGLDEQLFSRIANCESRNNPKAIGKTLDGGLFQYIPSTWERVRKKMGRDPNQELRFDFVENAETAGYTIRVEGTGHWNSSRSCWNI